MDILSFLPLRYISVYILICISFMVYIAEYKGNYTTMFTVEGKDFRWKVKWKGVGIDMFKRYLESIADRIWELIV